LTSDNLPDEVQDRKSKLGVILDGYLHSAPAINSAIGERGIIEGDFDQQEVDILVSVLNAGSLPATLNPEPSSQLATGPTLGSDTIRRGKDAMFLSMGLVLVFMVFYYRFAGIVACLALLANLVLVLAVMITVNAAFTLPGLAGLVLTVGMAVDANVLIYERIREELDRGAALRMAIRNGFDRATTTVVDANLTTLITGVVLFWVGEDQVKGFAVTLILGVTLSMYTAIFCSRLVFDVAEKKRWLTEMRMRRMIGGTNFDFLGKQRIAVTGSLAMIVLGLVAVFGRGKGLLDIDFTGGVSVQTMFDESQNITDIRRQLGDKLPDLAVSDIQIPGEPEKRRFMINTSIPPDEIGGGNQAQKYLDEVKQTIREVYGKRLSHYSMTWTPPKSDAPAGKTPAAPPVEPAAEPAAKPPAEPQTRNDLPSSTLLASADPSAVLLAQADPPEKAAAEAAPEKPAPQGPSLPGLGASAAKPTAESSAEKEPADSASAPVEPPSSGKNETPEPAATTTPFRTPRTRSTLDFGTHKLSYNALAERFEAQMGPGKTIDAPVEYEITCEGYRDDEDPERGHRTWEVAVDLPPEKVEALLQGVATELASEPYFPSSNTIGGKVAGNTQVLAVLALLASLLGIVGYIWFRFQRVMFAVAAVAALVHDVLITLGVIALSAYVANFLGFLLIEEFKIGLSVLAAFLTIIGYSLNDTIVVFDRIREVRGKAPALTGEMVNQSINQTLARTLLTSLTTLIVVVILYFLGGQGIHSFAFSLVVGVVVGTYSSVFIASPALLWMAQRGASPGRNRSSAVS
jgi:SecD/SecF fusion protein